jgi:hypothetical protein
LLLSVVPRLQAVTWDGAGEPFAGEHPKLAAVTKPDRHPQAPVAPIRTRLLARPVAVGKVSIPHIKYSVAAPPD